MTAYYNDLLKELALTNHGKAALLQDLLNWADSAEGADFRASLAHSDQFSPITAGDVLALLDDDLEPQIREELGMM